MRLLARGHTLVEAPTAAIGRAMAEAEAPDLVLLDCRLPDADGVDLVPWFSSRGFPVIMLTGVDDTMVVVEAMQRGALDYLVKGRMDAVSLERSLQSATETASLRRAVAQQQKQLGEQAAALEVKNREVRELANALTLTEQAERRRIADLLHDHLQQILYGARLLIQSLPDPDDEGAVERAERASTALSQGIQVIRRLTLELTPPVLDNEDFSIALRWLASHITETYDLKVTVAAENAVVVESLEVRVLLVELVREILFNTVKHAEARQAHVRLSVSEEALHLEVNDDGKGFDPQQVKQGSFGLYSVRGRLELLGGVLKLDSASGAGTRATLTVPLAATISKEPADPPELLARAVGGGRPRKPLALDE